jgi:hypothetical protein
MKITKRQLKNLIQEITEEPPLGPPAENPAVQVVLDQMEEMSINDLRTIWQAVSAITKRKRNELKAGLKKGTRVAWNHSQHGREVTGTVVRRGGKFVMVQPDGDTRTWKKWPDSLRVVA